MSSPPLVRITNHGKIQAWVEYALQFLEANPDKPLTFHTMPPARRKQVEPPTEEPTTPQTQPNDSPHTSTKKKNTSTTTIPRLISVVEIVKREYLKALDPALALSGKLSGLHQYNQIGELDQPDEPQDSSPEEQRQRDIALALSGKRHLRQHKIAYMKVTLSRTELPGLLAAGATYQLPEVRALSKSARTRLKRKLKTADQAS